MSDGYTKLFGSIIHSSVWSEPAHVRLVWVTMLALVNQDGLVEAAVPGLASAARVTLDECEDALRVLSSPDKYSRSKAHEGRRVDAVDGGWLLLNHATYRNRLSIEDRRARTAERTRKWRQTHSSESVTLSASHSVTERHQTSLSVTVTECDAGDDMQIQMQKQIQIGEEHTPQVDAQPEPPPPAKPKPQASAAVRLVFEFWVQETGRKRSALDKKRSARIAARLAEGFTADQLCEAIKNSRNDSFLMGSNDRGREFRGVETLLRDAAQVERLLELTTPTGKGRLTGQRLPAPRQPDSGYDPFAAAEQIHAEAR